MLAAQSAAATGAARSQLCTNPWPVDRLTTVLTSEWLTRKKAAMARTQTTARAGRNTPAWGWPPNSSERSSRSTRAAAQAAATATERMYWGTLNSRLTGWGSNSAWLTAIPTPVATTSTGGSRKTTPSTITMSQVPTEKRWLRSGTLTTNRSARTSPATYSSGCQAARHPPPARRRTAAGAYSATTTVAAATTARTNSQAARGSEVRTPRGSVLGSLTLARSPRHRHGLARTRWSTARSGSGTRWSTPGRAGAWPGDGLQGRAGTWRFLSLTRPPWGRRVARSGDGVSQRLRFCACRGRSCNAPTGPNETINLHDRATTYRVIPDATGCYPFPQLRGAVEVDRSTVCSKCNDLNWSFFWSR